MPTNITIESIYSRAIDLNNKIDTCMLSGSAALQTTQTLAILQDMVIKNHNVAESVTDIGKKAIEDTYQKALNKFSHTLSSHLFNGVIQNVQALSVLQDIVLKTK